MKFRMNVKNVKNTSNMYGRVSGITEKRKKGMSGCKV